MNKLLKDWEVNGLKEISYDYVATLRAHLALCVLSFKVRSSNMIGLPLWLSWHRVHLQFGRPGFNSWVGKISWRREQLPTPVFWPGEFYGLYSLWGRKE